METGQRREIFGGEMDVAKHEPKELSEQQRLEYLSGLLKMTINIKPIEAFKHIYKQTYKDKETDAVQKGGLIDLVSINQNLLFLLRDLSSGNDNYLGKKLEVLQKINLNKAIGEEIGNRPEVLVFEIDVSDRIPEKVNQFLMEHKSIYIKLNQSSKGADVYCIRLLDNKKYEINAPFYEEDVEEPLVVDSLEEFTEKYYITKGQKFIAEKEIPIAKTENNETWELRIIASFGSEFTHMYVDSTSQKKYEIKPSIEVVSSVIRNKSPNLSREEISELADSFLKKTEELALKVKSLTDKYQVNIAKEIIKESDFKDPAQYEEVINKCFSGSFLTVDITGIWEDDKLKPIIIEAQTSAQLPEKIRSEASQKARKNLLEKLTLLKNQLKDVAKT